MHRHVAKLKPEPQAEPPPSAIRPGPRVGGAQPPARGARAGRPVPSPWVVSCQPVPSDPAGAPGPQLAGEVEGERELSGRGRRCLSVTPGRRRRGREQEVTVTRVEQEGREGSERSGAGRGRNRGVTALSETRASARSTLHAAVLRGTATHVRGERWSP